ncbi:tetratricopeptide repeat protein [Candidatus Venteria ishoeyi]|uniref:tetratricopeptide repeat protein n=1 Tax=Candidatus Venteria ishoeyi TaxID=1899563 RepID=UPI0025A5625E|nr:tetratricopeptide repeat protein [Candidatus Venteria ishoeyi]MDM8544981.1 tetratricopeptide repeat protein [Candidatus Venteria ishoeyi]
MKLFLRNILIIFILILNSALQGCASELSVEHRAEVITPQETSGKAQAAEYTDASKNSGAVAKPDKAVPEQKLMPPAKIAEKNINNAMKNRPTFHSAEQVRIYHNSLYQLMIAEMAGFQGDYSTAAKHYYEVAKTSENPKIAARATRLSLYAKLPQLALDAAKLWYRLAPDNKGARQALIATLLQHGETDAAAEQIQAMLAASNIATDSADAQETDSQESTKAATDISQDEQIETLILLLKQGGNQKAAIEVMDKLVLAQPENAALLYLYARLLIGSEEGDKATSVLESLLNLQPNHPEAVLLYVELLHQQHSQPKALRFLRNLLQNYPDHNDWRMMYARMLVSAEEYDLAAQQFEHLLQENPGDYDTLYALSLIYLQNKNFKQARLYLNEILKNAELEEQRDTARYFLGQADEQEEKFSLAIQAYKGIDHSSQYYFSANVRVVLLYIDQKKYNPALEHLKSLNSNDAEESLTLLKLEAEIYTQQERHDAVLKVYQRGLDADPENVDLLYMHAMTAELLNELELSERGFRKILALEPENIDALNALGYTLADRTNRYQEAYELIYKAYEQKPDAFYILDSMGWVLYHLGEHKKALGYLRKALQLKDDPEIAAHLAEVLWVLGEEVEARHILKKAFAKFPDDKRLQKVIQKYLGAL